MGIMRRVGRWFGFGADETPPRPIADVLLQMANVGLLPRAGRAEALSVPAVLRARNLICSIATLPLVQRNAALEPVRLPLLEQIDPNVANVVTLAQTVEDLLFEGLSWWKIIQWDHADYPVYAEHVDFANVSLQPPGAPSPSPLPGGHDPRDAVVYMYGEPIPASRVIRFDSPNPGLLTAGGRAVRRALLLDTTSALYADNPRPLDYFAPKEGADPADDADILAMLNEWKNARKARSTAYVPYAVDYHTVDTPTPAELQLVELQAKATLDIANATGLDPEDLGVSTTSRTYQNGVDRRQDRINDTLAPYMSAITDRLSMQDVTRRGYRVGFDLDNYLKADPLTRATVYEKAGVTAWLTDDEARREEGLPALTPAQRAKLQPEPAALATPSNVIPIRRAAMGADDVDPLMFGVDTQPLVQVDHARRIMEGLAVPYGPDKIASKNGVRYRFQKGSLVYTEQRRNKLLRDHDKAQALGKLIFDEDREDGMFARYKVADGPDGDRALSEAEQGVRDGLSVGVEIFAAEPDPLNQGVWLVSVPGATWRETSVLAVPAFDDARVTRVAASADLGVIMQKCVTCGATLTEGVAHTCPTPPANQPEQPTGQPESAAIQLSNDQLKGLMAQPDLLRALMGVPAPATPAPVEQQFSLSQGQITALLAVPGGREMLLGLPAPEQRQTVDPTRRTAATKVQESTPYRFDRKGNLTRGSHDFSDDIIQGLHFGDGEALQRAEKFVAETFTQFDTDMADAATLNPSRQRPDMYVDQKSFAYPIWNAIDKGTLADITPFVLPKFNSASGMVAAHVEGVEPSLGTFTATNQTITPSAVSGKVSITREAWDQGGNPQLSGLVWRQMVKAWFEALEAAAVALLEAAAPTTITITTGVQDDVLVDEVKAALADLQFVRGGFTMEDAFAQVNFYKALAAARDADGRSLLPVVNPSNADGSAQTRISALDTAGVLWKPGWALAASGAVTANSYLIDRSDVSGWASAPNRLTFENVEVRYVHIGIWGYKALAITDLTGVRRFAYDPVP